MRWHLPQKLEVIPKRSHQFQLETSVNMARKGIADPVQKRAKKDRKRRIMQTCQN